MKTLFINGKFTAQRVTGVQRLATGLVTALDQHLQDMDSQDHWVLLCPPGARPPPLQRVTVRFVGTRVPSLHFWEQVVLPWHAAGHVLLNLAGPAPMLKRGQVCLLPDAAVFDHPEAYTKVFGAWYRLLFRTIGRTSLVLLTISEFSRQRLIHFLGPVAQRLRVIYCATEHMEAIAPEADSLGRLGLANTRYLLAVGSMNPTKNLPLLLDAFARVDDQSVRLVLVGGQNATVFVEQDMSSRRGTDARVVYTGPVGDEVLATLYRHATAFVFPSVYEGFGLPPLEAMTLGCPVVAARAASIPEVCGDAALYFDPNSVSEVAQAIERVLGDAVLRADLRCRGQVQAKRFTWARSAERLLQSLAENGLLSTA